MKHIHYLYFIGGVFLLLVYGLMDPSGYDFPKCPAKTLTGWLCPGCGSQRAIHQVLHGHFGEAFRLNILLLPAVSYALIGALASSFFPDRWPVIRTRYYGKTAAYVSLVVIVAFWIGRNLL